MAYLANERVEFRAKTFLTDRVDARGSVGVRKNRQTFGDKSPACVKNIFDWQKTVFKDNPD